jgi:hypothetical protein
VGCLAGAVFTWFVHRPNPTIITYGVTTTSLGADSTVKGLIPNFETSDGGRRNTVVHTHSIELSVPEGEFLDQADVVIAFPSPVRAYGTVLAEAPSLAHRIECKQLKSDPNDGQHILGLRCSLSPLKAGSGKFRIVMSTENQQPPTPVMAAKNADLMRADAYLLRTHRILVINPATLWIVAGWLFAIWSCVGLLREIIKQKRRLVNISA